MYKGKSRKVDTKKVVWALVQMGSYVNVSGRYSKRFSISRVNYVF